MFHQQGDKYIVARQELDPELKGITIDLNESESLAVVLQVMAQDGQATIETTRWIVGPKGTVEETLRRATREMSFDENGRLSAKPLREPVFASDRKPAEAAAPLLSATPVPMAPTTTATPEDLNPVAPPDTQTPPPVESQASVGLWIVGILTLAVISLLVWKRRA